MTEQTHIWEKYEKGIQHHNGINLYAETERNWNFFIGDQWKGVNFKDKNYMPPIENIIKPCVRLQYSTVAQQKRSIVYNDMTEGGQYADVVRHLTHLAEKEWERAKMDSLMWQMVKRGSITGDSFLYLYEQRQPTDSAVVDRTPNIAHQMIPNTNIYFSDEQEEDINKMEYIIIAERVPVTKVKRIAEKNGVPAHLIETITSDERRTEEKSDIVEVKVEKGKCTSLLYFEKTENGIAYSRSTETVIYDQGVLPFDVYPIVGYRWEENLGTRRGVSAVKYLIPNQLAINYTLYRREQSVKRTAFPHVVYDSTAIQNVDKLTEVGSTISVQNFANNPVQNLVSYLTPASISPDAERLQNELVTVTRELAGAGDAATGSVDPTKASGEAIKAARDQAALPLNEQVSAEIQTLEDLAILWFKMWTGYAVNGLEIVTEDDAGNPIKVVIDQQTLLNIKPNIKIDVSPIDPYSVMAEDNNLLAMLSAGQINFEEFVDSLSQNTNLPKAKFENIIKQRKVLAQQQMADQIANMQAQLEAEQAKTAEMEMIADEMS
jgi:hypothetical protein